MTSSWRRRFSNLIELDARHRQRLVHQRGYVAKAGEAYMFISEVRNWSPESNFGIGRSSALLSQYAVKWQSMDVPAQCLSS